MDSVELTIMVGENDSVSEEKELGCVDNAARGHFISITILKQV